MKVKTNYWRLNLSHRGYNPDNLDALSLTKFINDNTYINNKTFMPPDGKYLPIVCVIYEVSPKWKTKLFSELFKYLEKYLYNFPMDDILYWYYCIGNKLGLISYHVERNDKDKYTNIHIYNHHEDITYIFLQGTQFNIIIESRLSVGNNPITLCNDIYSNIYVTISRIHAEYKDHVFKFVGIGIDDQTVTKTCYINDEYIGESMIRSNRFNPIKIRGGIVNYDKLFVNLDLIYPLISAYIRNAKDLNNLYLDIYPNYIHSNNKMKYIDSLTLLDRHLDIGILFIEEYGYLFKDLPDYNNGLSLITGRRYF